MIISFNELKMVRVTHPNKKIVFTRGTFDLLHDGHVEFLKQAKTYGDILVVGVPNDKDVNLRKGHDRPINTLDQRMSVLDSIKKEIIIVDGIRGKKVLDVIVGFRDKIIISINSNFKDRYNRTLLRKEKFGEDSYSEEDFRALENAGFQKDVDILSQKASYHINNNGSILEYERDILDLLKKLKIAN